MKIAIAFGLFAISLIMGIALVILGAALTTEVFIWTGMLLIALGVLNLAVRLIFPEPKPAVELKVIRAAGVRRKTTRKRVVKKKRKKPAKKRKTKKKPKKRKKKR